MKRISKLSIILVVLAACSAEPEMTSTVESYATGKATTTKIRVNGRSAFAILFDAPTQTNGFLNASKDQIANTSALDFAYATPSTTDPDIVILIQGAGEIPNSAFVTTTSSATLSLTTPFPVTRCEVSLETGDFECAETTPISFDLTWVQDGFAEVHEKIKRTEKLGPVTTKFKGEFDQRSTLIDGTWDGRVAENMNGNLLDTQNVTVIREITVQTP
jgi:hypothetical protein